MSDKIHAFPFPSEAAYHCGMTLRDYFAAQAVAGLCTGSPSERDPKQLVKNLAFTAYAVADAMLEYRNVKP